MRCESVDREIARQTRSLDQDQFARTLKRLRHGTDVPETQTLRATHGGEGGGEDRQ